MPRFQPTARSSSVSAKKRGGTESRPYSLSYSVYLRTDGLLGNISTMLARFTNPETADTVVRSLDLPTRGLERRSRPTFFGKLFLASSLSRVVRTAINVNELASPHGYLGDRAASCARFRRVCGLFLRNPLISIATECIFRKQKHNPLLG